MGVARKRPKGVRYGAPFGLSVLAMSLAPNQIGYQDLVALMASKTEVPQRVRAHMLASPFGTIHLATFSLPQPIGTQIPEPRTEVAGLGGADPDTTGALGRDLSGGPMTIRRSPLDFPTVNRRLKGDLLITRPHDEATPSPGGSRDLTPGRVKTVSFTPPEEPLPEPSTEQEAAPQTAALTPKAETEPFDPLDGGNGAARVERLYFGNSPVGNTIGTIESWPADEELVVERPPAHDPDIKQAALIPFGPDFNFETAGAVPMDAKAADAIDLAAGKTVAAKGEVTGAGRRPKTPAERLNLDARQRAKSEKCLADAVYFESRGEPKRGQIAVAQVVMNRVFSGFYPNKICGVVYQNADRKLACQFTFACDGTPDKIDEPDMWQQAKEIAHDMLDGKLWLPEIGHSTHYHAYWVHPSWVNEMRKIYKIGVHSFYRPRAWGDTVEVPHYTFVAPPGRNIRDEDVKS